MFGLGNSEPAQPPPPPECFDGVVAGSIWKGPGQNPERHTIIGAGTVLAKEVRKAIAGRDPTAKCRFVKAKGVPKPLFESDETYQCDLDKPNAIDYVVQGSKIVYLLHEFDFDQQVWAKQWPKLMRNVLNSCAKFKAKLVYVQTNAYVYSDSAVGDMTEESEQVPSSVKGKVMKEVSDMLLNDVKAGETCLPATTSYLSQLTSGLPTARLSYHSFVLS
jgi:hypothetical protein